MHRLTAAASVYTADVLALFSLTCIKRLIHAFNSYYPLLFRLDVYVWDYLCRRGFQRAAKSLLSEAGMAESPDVPLKTPQGLLFE